MKYVAIVFALIVTAAPCARATAPAPAPATTGLVEILLRGPDGKPLANTDVIGLIHFSGRNPNDDKPETHKTDAAGKLALGFRSDSYPRIEIMVKGVGYGRINTLAIQPGQTIAVTPPPLAAWGVIEGKVNGWNPAWVLHARPDGIPFDPKLVLTVTPEGKFRQEVTAQRWAIYAMAGQNRVARHVGDVAVGNGQTVSVAVEPIPADVLARENAEAQRWQDEHNKPPDTQPENWAWGIVKDERGNPVPNADVYACVYDSDPGINDEGEEDYKVATGQDGQYLFKGPWPFSRFTARLVAHKLGYASASATILRRGARADFVLPDKGGRLEVTVILGGKPAPGVTVRLGDRDIYDSFFNRTGDGAMRQELGQIFAPMETTETDGVAKFDLLDPGAYRLTAWSGQGHHMDSNPPGPSGDAEGIAVRAGQTTTYRLAIFDRTAGPPVRMLSPDGRPAANRRVYLAYGQGDQIHWGEYVKLDHAGQGIAIVHGPGLWRSDFKYPASGAAWSQAAEPYDGVRGFVAASPSLQIKEPITFTARRFEPGTLAVDLRDEQGRPAQGTVEISYGPIGSTDPAGRVDFGPVESWPNYWVRGSLAGKPRPDLGDYHGPFPADDQLVGQVAVFGQEAEVTPDSNQHLVLGAQRVGYVRGFVKPARGLTTQDYYLDLGYFGISRDTDIHYRGSTGEFVAGPFAPGKHRLRLRRSVLDETGNASTCALQEVVVEPGRLTRIDLVAPETAAAPIDPQESMVERIKQNIYLSDGITPAKGVQVKWFAPGTSEPIINLPEDGSGNLQYQSIDYGQKNGKPDFTPRLAAWLPGSCGAVVVPEPQPGEKIKIVLPKPMALKGTVTIAGQSPAGRSGKIRVWAGILDKAWLAQVMDVRTTAQEDGSFELAGLTPGKYRVQAALDDIWLSPMVEIEVADGPLPPMTLAIPALGGPVRVTLLDAAGKPMAGQKITLDRPAGPLAWVLWPRQWQADGAGQVYIPALEAGKHTLHVLLPGAGGKTFDAQIAADPLPTDKARQETVRVASP